MKFNKTIVTILLMLMVFLLFQPASALDVNNEKPALFWGVPEATWREGDVGFVSYDEPEATIVIRNTAPATLPDLVFNQDCVLDSNLPISQCFNFDNSSLSKIYSSSTYADGFLKSSTAVLKYPAVNVIGSTYSISDLENFAFWGRHLRQSKDNSGSNAFWQAKNYQFNPAAQAYWNSGNNSTMNTTINRLLQNTRPLPSSSMAGSFYGICGQVMNCDDENQYPDGRVWLSESSVQVGNGSFPQLNYDKKSTIIIGNGTNQSDLIIDASVLPISSTDQNASIGFIVRKGNVTITNSSGSEKTIKAAIFAPNGRITVSKDNITLTGSFVAKDFSVTGSNVNFVQDTRGETAWPPGFRDLQLPAVFSK